VAIEEGNILALRFPGGSFDRVLAEAVTLFVDRPRAAAELVRVCRPGGMRGAGGTARAPVPHGTRGQVVRPRSTARVSATRRGLATLGADARAAGGLPSPAPTTSPPKRARAVSHACRSPASSRPANR
jgi:hypothetical protein